jgi:hypothetical protein
MKRRRFIQSIATAPALVVPAESIGRTKANAPETPLQSRTPGDPARLECSTPEAVAESAPRTFTPAQFAALRKLSDLLLPSMNGMPGALEAGAPEFLDFLVGASPADRQAIYKTGLDTLNAQSRKLYGKPFADVNESQAVVLLAPLRQPWTYDPPADPLARFLREVKQDVRTATVNSREYASASGTRRGAGLGQYWYPLD